MVTRLSMPLFGPKLVDAFMALGTFEAAAESPETAAEDSGKKLLLSYTVPAGEGSKCRDMKAAIEDFMVRSHHTDRPSLVSLLLTNEL